MILRMAWSSMQFWQGSKGTHNIGVKDGFAHGMAKRAVLARRQAKGIIIEGMILPMAWPSVQFWQVSGAY